MHAKTVTTSVSVVIPARNEEIHISTALASVAAQGYPLELVECVVVDNASTDATAATVRAFSAERGEPAISLVCEPERGVARAKNRGARAAQGDVLIFLDADSRMTPTLIRDVVAEFDAGNPAGSIRIVADSDDPLEQGFFALMEVGKVLFGVRAQMFYCDRHLFLSLRGFRPELRQAEDLEFLRRVRRVLRERGSGSVCHVQTSAIATSTRRLQGGRFRRNLARTFVRWALAAIGVGRRWDY